MDIALIAALVGSLLGVLICTITCIVCRVWRRNRYYKKVQHSLDEEERAFQETLARSYHDDAMEFDLNEKEKLAMLDTYMQGLEASEGNAPGDAEPLPSCAEDVDKFMKDLAVAASGGS